MKKDKKGFVYAVVRFFGIGFIGIMIIFAAAALGAIRIVWNIMDSLLAGLSGGEANDDGKQANKTL